jgi:hypothetical protein
MTPKFAKGKVTAFQEMLEDSFFLCSVYKHFPIARHLYSIEYNLAKLLSYKGSSMTFNRPIRPQQQRRLSVVRAKLR